MTRRKALWLSGVIATFMLFYFLIPNSIYNLSPLLFSVVGAALLTFFLIQAIGDFKSFRAFNNPKPEEKNLAHKIAPWMVFPGIVMVFVFVINFSSNEREELLAHGLKAKGTIIDGSSMKTRRGGTYEVTVIFKTKDGKEMTVKESVGEDEFKRFYKGQEVELVYSSRNPDMVELLTNSNTIETYSGVKDRDINAKDLMKLVTFSPDSVGEVLNTINYQWTYEKEENTWINERKNLLIKVQPNQTVNYLTSGDAFITFPTELKKQEFEEIPSADKKVKLFENDEFLASLETQIMESRGIATIITMHKK